MATFPSKKWKMKMPKTQLSSCLRHPTRRKLLKIWRKKSTLLRVWEWFDCIKTTACSISKTHFVGELLNKWMKFEELKRKQLCETSSENDKKKANTFRDFFKSEKLPLLPLSPLVLGVFQLHFLRFCSIVWTPKFAKTNKTKEGMLRTLL